MVCEDTDHGGEGTLAYIASSVNDYGDHTDHGNGIALIVPHAQYGIFSCIISSPSEKGQG